MRDGPVHDPFDALVREHRHALQGRLQPGHDAVVVARTARAPPPMACRPARRCSGRLSRRCRSDRTSAPGAHSPTPCGRRVPRAALCPALELGDGLGHQVVVGHAGDGQVQTDPLTDLPGVGAAGVDHVLAHDIALLGADQPLAVRLALDVQHTIVADDLAPVCRAPLANAKVAPAGSTWPSSGVCSAAITPRGCRRGAARGSRPGRRSASGGPRARPTLWCA